MCVKIRDVTMMVKKPGESSLAGWKLVKGCTKVRLKTAVSFQDDERLVRITEDVLKIRNEKLRSRKN